MTEFLDVPFDPKDSEIFRYRDSRTAPNTLKQLLLHTDTLREIEIRMNRRDHHVVEN
jgi:hypothetical protein